MNERIRELAEQAGFQINPLKGMIFLEGLNPTANLKLEKFAELIVQECAELSKNSQYANTKGEYYEGFNEALVYVGNKIKKHFGVNMNDQDYDEQGGERGWAER